MACNGGLEHHKHARRYINSAENFRCARTGDSSSEVQRSRRPIRPLSGARPRCRDVDFDQRWICYLQILQLFCCPTAMHTLPSVYSRLLVAVQGSIPRNVTTFLIHLFSAFVIAPTFDTTHSRPGTAALSDQAVLRLQKRYRCARSSTDQIPIKSLCNLALIGSALWQVFVLHRLARLVGKQKLLG